MNRAIFAFLALAAAGLAEEPIADSDLKTVPDLLRGFDDAELAEARKAVPAREEPPLPNPNPREVVVRGVVFEDRNANGERDTGEPGLTGVSISDGQFVRTASEDGSYGVELCKAIGSDHFKLLYDINESKICLTDPKKKNKNQRTENQRRSPRPDPRKLRRTRGSLRSRRDLRRA